MQALVDIPNSPHSNGPSKNFSSSTFSKFTEEQRMEFHRLAAELESTRDVLHNKPIDPKISDSETTGFGLCEFLPKRTWIIGDSYVHPNWYLRRKRVRSKKPWQMTGLNEKWRAKKLFKDLEAKTSRELGLDDMHTKKITELKQFDDPKLLKFELTPAVNDAAEKVYNYDAFHDGIIGKLQKDDSLRIYKRPVYVDLDHPMQEKYITPVAVTVKALTVDNQPVAFITSVSSKVDHTSEKVFKMLETSLSQCGTLLHQGKFSIIPPKGRNCIKIYHPKETSKKSTKFSKKRQKTAKSEGKAETKGLTHSKLGGSNEASRGNRPERMNKGSKKSQCTSTCSVSSKQTTRETPVSPMKQLIQQRKHVLEKEMPDSAWFSDPAEPLEMSCDLLQLTEMPQENRTVAAQRMQWREATNKREFIELQKWHLLAKTHCKVKRRRNIISRYIKKPSSEETANEYGAHELKKVVGTAVRLNVYQDSEIQNQKISDSAELRSDGSSTPTDDEDTEGSWYHDFRDPNALRLPRKKTGSLRALESVPKVSCAAFKTRGTRLVPIGLEISRSSTAKPLTVLMNTDPSRPGPENEDNTFEDADTSNWLDEEALDEMVFNPIEDHRQTVTKSTGCQPLKIQTAISDANLLHPMIADNYRLSERRTKNLIREFERLGLFDVTIPFTNDTMRSEFLPSVSPEPKLISPDDADETERLKSDLEETHLYYGLQGVLIKSKMHSSCRCRPLTTKSGKETSVDSSCPCETSATGCQGHCAKEWGKLEKQFEMECATDLTPAYQKSVGKSSEMAIFAKRVSTFRGAHEEEALRNAIKERRAVIDRVENELTKRLYGGK